MSRLRPFGGLLYIGLAGVFAIQYAAVTGNTSEAADLAWLLTHLFAITGVLVMFAEPIDDAAKRVLARFNREPEEVGES